MDLHVVERIIECANSHESKDTGKVAVGSSCSTSTGKDNGSPRSVLNEYMAVSVGTMDGIEPDLKVHCQDVPRASSFLSLNIWEKYTVEV